MDRSAACPHSFTYRADLHQSGRVVCRYCGVSLADTLRADSREEVMPLPEFIRVRDLHQRTSYYERKRY